MRADAAEEIGCAESVPLLRDILRATADPWLRQRIVIKLAALGAASAEEIAAADELEESAPASTGTRAGEWYRRVALSPASTPTRRLRAMLAMAERHDEGWEPLLANAVGDPVISTETRYEATHRLMLLDDEGVTGILWRTAEDNRAALDISVPVLAAMAGAKDERARQVLNEIERAAGPGLAVRFPQLAAWREEVGDRSYVQAQEIVAQGRPADFYQAAGNVSVINVFNGPVDAGSSTFGTRRSSRPAIWGNVPMRNVNFVGRENLLAELPAPGSADGLVALTGIAGVGKTQLAIEYAHRHASEFDVVWWIPADQILLVPSSLAALASQLGLRTSYGIEEGARASLDVLRRGDPYGRWLVIFDNADRPEDLRKYLLPGPGTILITSRNPAWEGLARTIAVDVFGRRDSATFLEHRLLRGIDPADTESLATELGDLPLALEQAAAVIAETGMPVAEYLRLLTSAPSLLLAEGGAPDYPVPATATLRLSVATVQQTLPEAVELLRCCAFLAPRPIERETLSRGAEGAMPPLADLLNSPITFSRAIRELTRFGLVRLGGATRSALSVHRLVQVLVRDALDPAEQERYRHQAQRLLAAATPASPEDVDQWDHFRALVPHLLASGVGHSHDDELVRDAAQRTVRYLIAAGQPRPALDLARDLEHTWRAVLEPTSPDGQILQAHRALAASELGLFSEAARYISPDRNLADAPAEARAPLARARGAGMRAAGRFTEALELDEAAFTRLSGDDPNAGRARADVATDLVLLGRYYDARVLLDHSVLMDDPLIRTCLGQVTRLVGGYEQAMEIGEQALELSRGRLGADHPVTLRATCDLAVANRLLDADDGDQPRWELRSQAVEYAWLQLAATCGQDHPETLAAAVTLAIQRTGTGDLTGAIELTADCVDRYTRRLGADHPFALACSGNHAILLRLGGYPGQAQELDHKCHAQLAGSLGERHPYTLAAATNLASDEAAFGRRREAVEGGKQALADWRKTLGANHPFAEACAANLAMDETGEQKPRQNIYFDPPRL